MLPIFEGLLTIRTVTFATSSLMLHFRIFHLDLT
jgi:hypothetical protein